MVLFQISVVIIFMTSYKNKIQFLTQSSDALWSDTEVTEEIKTKIEETAQQFDKIALTFYVSVFCGVFWVILPPFLTTEADLFVGGRIDKKYHLIVAIYQTVLLSVGEFVVPVGAIFFASLCMSFSEQLEVLNMQVQNLFYRVKTMKQQYNAIVVCIHRHDNLLQCIRLLRKTYSFFLLEAVGNNMLTIFIECYRTSENFHDLKKGGANALIIFCQLLQLTFYCMPANRLSEQVNDEQSKSHDICVNSVNSLCRYPMLCTIAAGMK